MKKTKFIILFSLILFIAIPSFVFSASKAINAILAPHIQIVNEGTNINTSANPPIIYKDRAYVPLRTVSEAVGYEVEWDNENSRVNLSEAENTIALEKNGLQVIDYSATPDAMVSIHDVVSARYVDGQILYTINEPLAKEATATFEVISPDNKVVQTKMIILNETEPGTYTHHFHSPYFNPPYDGTKGNSIYFQEKMLDDYSYRLKLN